MKNLTEDHDLWGMPIEEKEPEKPVAPGKEMHDRKQKVFEANNQFDLIMGKVGGILLEFNSVKEEIESLYKGDK